MTRKELFEAVKKYQLQEKIKSYYNTDYTHLSNSVLEKAVKTVRDNKKSKEEQIKVLQGKNTKPIDEGKFDRLVRVLQKKYILLPSEITYIYSAVE